MEVHCEFLSPRTIGCERVLPQVQELYAQLSPTGVRPSLQVLERVARNGKMLLVLNNHKVVGMGLLIQEYLLGKAQGVIHEVVVAKEARGGGIGRLIMIKLEDEAKRLGLDSICLTSHPNRLAANHLYQDMGYEQRETNVYQKNCRRSV